MSNVIQAVNMVTGEKAALLVEPKLIDDQDLPGLEKVLSKHVSLASANVSIYI